MKVGGVLNITILRKFRKCGAAVLKKITAGKLVDLNEK